jgi:RhtB (resistance to homoserine/threonine) family protein
MLFTLIPAYVVFLVAVMSPGPDFAIMVRNSVRHGRQAGIYTAAGIALANLIHIAYINIGLGALIAHSIMAFNVIKILAAVYLIWLGCTALRSKPQAQTESISLQPVEENPRKSFRSFFLQGFLTNALNPKAAIFWLSYFSIVLNPHMPVAVLLGFVAILILTAFVWFATLSYVLAHARVREKFLRMGHWFDRATGIVLVALGLKVALAQR